MDSFADAHGAQWHKVRPEQIMLHGANAAYPFLSQSLMDEIPAISGVFVFGELGSRFRPLYIDEAANLPSIRELLPQLSLKGEPNWLMFSEQPDEASRSGIVADLRTKLGL